jgi:hypothetical protein
MAAARRLAGRSCPEYFVRGDDVIRLLGFLVGSAASIAMILVILGVPDFNLSRPLVDAENAESALQVVEEVTTDLEVIASGAIDEIAVEVIDDVTDAAGGLVDELLPAELPTAVAEPAIDLVAPEEPQVAELPTVQPNETANDRSIEDDVKWHAFWNPFRSRIAAEGFVGQLEKVTGLDYRVIKLKAGVYEVAFGYEDDAERRNKMSLIASATGLDLPKS